MPSEHARGENHPLKGAQILKFDNSRANYYKAPGEWKGAVRTPAGWVRFGSSEEYFRIRRAARMHHYTVPAPTPELPDHRRLITFHMHRWQGPPSQAIREAMGLPAFEPRPRGKGRRGAPVARRGEEGSARSAFEMLADAILEAGEPTDDDLTDDPEEEGGDFDRPEE